MRKLLAAFAAAGLALAPVACNKSPEGGNPGTSDSFTISENALSSGPAMTTVKKGETKEIELTVKAKKDFKGKVSLKADHPDKIKIEVKPSSVDLTPGSDVKVHLMVTNDGAAAADSNIIKVTGTPDHGTANTLDVKVKTE
jgi:uncharacterized membrane protein